MAEILNERETEVFIKSFTLLPSKGGVFEFVVNGELLYSKKLTGRHAEPGEIRALLQPMIDAVKPPGFQLPGGD